MGLIARGMLILTLSGFGAAVSTAAPAPGAAVACRPPDSPIAEAQRKFHPGHYVALGRSEDKGDLARVLGKGVIGVQRRYRWAELEPSEDQYQFSAIARDLETAQS